MKSVKELEDDVDRRVNEWFPTPILDGFYGSTYASMVYMMIVDGFYSGPLYMFIDNECLQTYMMVMMINQG